MAEYLLYCFKNHKLERCDAFEAADDQTAIQEALERHDGAAAELWSGSRKIHDFEDQTATR